MGEEAPVSAGTVARLKRKRQVELEERGKRPLHEGYEELTGSWSGVLRDLKERGLYETTFFGGMSCETRAKQPIV